MVIMLFILKMSSDVAVGYRLFNQTHWDVCDTLNQNMVGDELGFLIAVQYLTEEVGKLEEFIVEQNGILNFNDGILVSSPSQ